jgi:hypothetical protein
VENKQRFSPHTCFALMLKRTKFCTDKQKSSTFLLNVLCFWLSLVFGDFENETFGYSWVSRCFNVKVNKMHFIHIHVELQFIGLQQDCDTWLDINLSWLLSVVKDCFFEKLCSKLWYFLRKHSEYAINQMFLSSISALFVYIKLLRIVTSNSHLAVTCWQSWNGTMMQQRWCVKPFSHAMWINV